MQASACHSFRVRGWLLLNRALVTLCREPSTVSLGSATGLHTCLPWTHTQAACLGLPRLTTCDIAAVPWSMKSQPVKLPMASPKSGTQSSVLSLSFRKDFLGSCCTQEKARRLEPLRTSILTAADCKPFAGSCPSRMSSLCPVSRPAQAQALDLFPIQQALSQGSC